MGRQKKKEKKTRDAHIPADAGPWISHPHLGANDGTVKVELGVEELTVWVNVQGLEATGMSMFSGAAGRRD